MEKNNWSLEIQAPPELHEPLEQFFNALCWKIKHADGFISGYEHGLSKQWIPCSKELPQKEDNYLVCGKNNQISVNRFFDNPESEKYWKKAVLAWIPLEHIEQLPSAQPERDIPIKPKETTDKAWGIPVRQAVCPKCDYYLGRVAFLGDYKGKRVTYCETCGQAIDWEGWDFDE